MSKSKSNKMSKTKAKSNMTTEVLNPAIVAAAPVVISPLELAKQALAAAREQVKALKVTEPKVKKEPKGVPVSFQNQAGETITGNGTLYYVVRFNGKLHYKAADAVTLLTEADLAEIAKVSE